MPMTPEEIKAALADRGMTMTAIGRRLRSPQTGRPLTPQQVRRVIHGGQSRRVRRYIARVLGRPETEVFAPPQKDTAA